MHGRTVAFSILLALCVGQAHAQETPGLAAPQVALDLTGSVALSRGVAEISAFDPQSARLFVVDGSSILKVVDLSDPAAPRELPAAAIDVAADLARDLGARVADANSIAIRNGVVAVAVASDPTTDPGYVAFYGTDGSYRFACRVGALPDMITFTPNGRWILVANEGEPGDVDPKGSISIIDARLVLRRDDCARRAVRTAGFERFDGRENRLRARGVRIFPGKTFSNDVEPEYIAVSANSRLAWVTLQEANTLAQIDIANGKVRRLLPLGTKDHSQRGFGMDASDEDGGIRIRPWPVRGLYMPDAIASFAVGGRTYLVTANEGDDRGENERIGDLDLDPAAFPNAARLQREAALGRLAVSSIDGDTDGDGDYDALYSYGARSFTIWNAAGRPVHDSGDFIERRTALVTPHLFNADDGDPEEFDTRSDAKGPEPEGATVGQVLGRTYAFIGLERAGGGVMTFDVTNPAAPLYVEYVRRDEDISPEGLAFIAAEDSPSGEALLVVSHEVSGTVTVYTVRPSRNEPPRT